MPRPIHELNFAELDQMLDRRRLIKESHGEENSELKGSKCKTAKKIVRTVKKVFTRSKTDKVQNVKSKSSEARERSLNATGTIERIKFGNDDSDSTMSFSSETEGTHKAIPSAVPRNRTIQSSATFHSIRGEAKPADTKPRETIGDIWNAILENKDLRKEEIIDSEKNKSFEKDEGRFTEFWAHARWEYFGLSQEDIKILHLYSLEPVDFKDLTPMQLENRMPMLRYDYGKPTDPVSPEYCLRWLENVRSRTGSKSHSSKFNEFEIDEKEPVCVGSECRRRLVTFPKETPQVVSYSLVMISLTAIAYFVLRRFTITVQNRAAEDGNDRMHAML